LAFSLYTKNSVKQRSLKRQTKSVSIYYLIKNMAQTTIKESDYKVGDEVEYKHPSDGWLKGVFIGFHTPELAPPGCRWSFIEICINGKLHKAYSLNQIRK